MLGKKSVPLIRYGNGTGPVPCSSLASTNVNEEVELTASIDRQAKTITEVSLRRHLKLEDNKKGDFFNPTQEPIPLLVDPAPMPYESPIQSVQSLGRDVSPPSGINFIAILIKRYGPVNVSKILQCGRLPKTCKAQLKILLKNNMDIFAWESTDITGVPWRIIEHNLNVNASIELEHQKSRVLAPEKSKVVARDVGE
ncbi:hypothetical protein Tco_1242070 [Tanacetum coccineum]